MSEETAYLDLANQIVIFGTRRFADQWIHKNNADPKKVILANQPEKLRGARGPVYIVEEYAGNSTITDDTPLVLLQTWDEIEKIWTLAKR